MAKKGMKRQKPGDGMSSEKNYKKKMEVDELQGKAKESKQKATPK